MSAEALSLPFPEPAGPSVVVHHGDCLDVLPTLAPQSIDSVVTSPPYAMQRAKQYGGVPEKEYPDWTVTWMRGVRASLKERGSVLINIREHIRNGEMSDYVHRTRMALRADGWIECDELIWLKPNGPPVGDPGRTRRSWERILWFAPSRRPAVFPRANGNKSSHIGFGGASTINSASWVSGTSSGKYCDGIARSPDFVSVGLRENPNGIGHPGAYPPRLAAWMVKTVTPPGGTVLDPFAGSGTTLVAAKAEGFNAIGIEREAEYVAIIKARVGA